ncbi:putative factor independent urate hydroxylase [Helianthus debilis subsp. tardiflorus]
MFIGKKSVLLKQKHRALNLDLRNIQPKLSYKNGSLWVTSDVVGLSLLKITQSGFEGFICDQNTILPETRSRIRATEVSASWRYQFESLSSINNKPLQFTEKYLCVKKVLMDTFFGPPKEGVYSPSVQATLMIWQKLFLAGISFP